MICFENIIGLSRTECECQDPKPEGYNESKSGLYLDELEGFNLNVAEGADDCSRGSLWDRMNRAVSNAKEDFITNLLGCINTQYKPRAENFSGQIGAAEFQNVLNLNQPYVGMKIQPYQLKGGVITLKRVGVIINQSKIVTIKIIKSVNKVGTEIGSFTSPMPVVANQITWISLSPVLELPMWSYGGRVDYYIQLVVDGFQPVDNKRDCGCGGVQRPYLPWFNFQGATGSDLSNLNTFNETGIRINGVVADLSVKCRTTDIICSEEMPLDFQDSGMAREIAAAIRFKAASKLYYELISSNEINRYTLINNEMNQALADKWEATYQQWIQYFCENLNVGTNDCLVCKDNKQIVKGGILA